MDFHEIPTGLRCHVFIEKLKIFLKITNDVIFRPFEKNTTFKQMKTRKFSIKIISFPRSIHAVVVKIT